MADGSQRHEEGCIGNVRDQAVADFRRVVIGRHPVAVIGWITVEMLSQAADHIVFAKSAQCVDRTVAFRVPCVDRFLIPGEVLIVEAFGRLRDCLRPCLFLRRIIFALIARWIWGRDHRDLRLVERAFETRIRRCLVLSPAVIR
jgi:hypothetical protein